MIMIMRMYCFREVPVASVTSCAFVLARFLLAAFAPPALASCLSMYSESVPRRTGGPSTAGLDTSESIEIRSNQAGHQEWLAAKRTFREAACRVLSRTMLEHGTSMPSDDALRGQHADAGQALLVSTLRLLNDRGGSLAPEQLPVEDFTGLSRELLLMYSLALCENEEHLKIRLDAVGMLLSYLGEEVSGLQGKHSSWVSTGGESRGRPR
ncbi:hypothetical protein L227DRAFT_617923 [Lentinus tigrinus ALCF2SS1-6]|uniref:Uncharacterized protein n=1 Tax=Lentinus tigrinus ALCF2SS1-6 TaxID=1328759 RepID=A0A5C2RP64_9APHY|nr:hypothetical protein L227DRAFT_617923 [Lentinus tigrinus ALCF2SS1-6]